MKKITLVATFSFFLAVAAFAQTDNKDNSAAPATFQRIESTIRPQQQSTVTSQTDSKQAAADKGQSQTLKMVTDASVNTAPGTIQKVSSKANTAKVQTTTAPQSGAVQNAVTPAGNPKQ